MGKYLFTHKQPGDRVGCEPLGYVAYCSRMPVYDYPGLANPEVTDFLKNNPADRNLTGMLEHFRPEWIALREHEYDASTMPPAMQYLTTEYQVQKIFHADPQVDGIFRVEYNVDRIFYLLHRHS